MSDLMLNLKINHHSHAKDFVIAYTEWLSVNSAIDVVELHASISVPVPVQSKSKRFTCTTDDVIVSQVNVRVTSGNFPSSPASLASPITVLDNEEVFQRFDTAERTRLAIPSSVFASQKV